MQAVLDRFAQVEPNVLLAVDGYRYGVTRHRSPRRGGGHSRRACRACTTPSLVPYLGGGPMTHMIAWSDLVAEPGPARVRAGRRRSSAVRVVLVGHHGLPKPIVHGHGGILLEHLKVLGLQADLGPSDRFFWFTTTGWMMWNYLVQRSARRARLVLFDGDPSRPRRSARCGGSPQRPASRGSASARRTSLPAARLGCGPASSSTCRDLRAVGATGAPLPADGFRWVYDSVAPDVMLSPITGGTDVCSAFVGGMPDDRRSWEGEISVPVSRLPRSRRSTRTAAR